VSSQADVRIESPASNEAGLVLLEHGQLIPGRYQPRTEFKQQALYELGRSFLENNVGIIEPIIVRPANKAGFYEIVAGERRWRAAQLVGLAKVPCLVRLYSDIQALQVALVENDQREDLNSMERARAYQTAAEEFELTHEALASMLAISRVKVTNHLRLFQLPLAVQDLLACGDLTESKVRCLFGINAGDAVRIARKAVAEQLSYRQIEALAKAAKPGKPAKKAGAQRQDPDERRWLDTLSARLGHEAQLEKMSGDKQGGYLKIRYMTMDDLGSITRKIFNGKD
jgi:ParB family transcriptional regulator, chromosome partitioning protein